MMYKAENFEFLFDPYEHYKNLKNTALLSQLITIITAPPMISEY